MSQREMVCSCEDITTKEVMECIHSGAKDTETIKRYTGLGTGYCQGRQCLGKVGRLLHRAGAQTQNIRPITARPPATPVSLAHLAAGQATTGMYPSIDAAPPQAPPRLSTANLAPLPSRASIVIIGGGVMGLSLAYYLSELGMSDVLVLEKSYLNSGASGRNGGGIRAQFSSETTIELMLESIERCKRFASEIGINVWFRQGGYLFVARDEQTLTRLENNVPMQNRLGVPSEMLSPKKVQKIVPTLNTTDLAGACYNPDDGVIFPWPFVYGYSKRATERGVNLALFTEVTGLDVQNGSVVGVHTERGSVACDLVVNAAAAWSPQIAAMAGVELPNRPERHEILVTESVKPFLDPLVSELGSGMYFSQSMRGEIVGGITDKSEVKRLEMRSSYRFAQRMARGLWHRCPPLGDIRVVRQWAGCYDVTPDRQPIVGEVDSVKNFFQLHGFVGHGFMMAPAVGQVVADYLLKGKSHAFLEQNRLERFKNQEGRQEETMIIG